jgi:uncharacterized membrane protein
MQKEDKLNAFLDAFLGSGKQRWSADADFREEQDPTGQEKRERNRKDPDGIIAPGDRGKLPARTIVSVFLILLLIPLTIWIGIRFLNDRKYLLISLLIAIYCMIPFFMVFESRKPQARELLIISVLVSIAVAGRAAFFMVPGFKPMAAVAIITGVCFGAESGFLVGAISMLVSNMMFGQGPWTPWQMFSMGIIGFLAGILFQKGWLKAKKGSLCIYGFLATLFIYGGIMNPTSLLMMSYAVTKESLLAVYISGIPVDLVHASATVFFLFLAARPMIEKLERIKIKYGLIQDGY